MPLNIVLVEPEIHTNTGNIGRLSLASGSNLHLIKPFGFELSDARLKRAGLDYWKHISLFIYEDYTDFLNKNKNVKMVFLSSHGKKLYWDINYAENMFLIFGKESKGLSPGITKNNLDHTYKIPLQSDKVRSINLANAVSIVVYEGLRNIL
ncbi:MAG: tRNA (cytidine(34)-2'-O)-methyltransferase [Flavobacteriaceae bacterium]|nr:tRNA (cytidine(34)-2'-O)-methyltransferase [Flavobacteriaceae bacterium]